MGSDSLIALFYEQYSVYWHGIIMAAAVLMTVVTACIMRKLQRERVNDMLVLAVIAMPCALIGGRMFFSWHGQGVSLFSSGEPLFKSLSEGGYGLYGALAGVLLAAVATSLILRVNLPRLLDALAPALALGIAMGRCASYFTTEDRGPEVTVGFLQCAPFSSLNAETGEWELSVYFFEAMCALGIFALLAWALVAEYRTCKLRCWRGDIALLFMILYGLSQSFLEYLRTDALYWNPRIITKLHFILISQAISAVLATIALSVFILRQVYKKGFSFTTLCPIVIATVCFCAIFNMELRINTTNVVTNHTIIGEGAVLLMAMGIWLFLTVDSRENSHKVSVSWLNPKKWFAKK